jgi:pseudaminic acid biosynthesis-associated methylase
MTKKTEDKWAGNFGQAYTDRNPQNGEELDELYRRDFGLTRSALNVEFLDALPRSARVLEVGCNIGLQLGHLDAMGFADRVGIDVQHYALTQARRRHGVARFAQSSAATLPFADNTFDLVYTSGVLIHIAPDQLSDVFDEMYRCARTYIWGMEYYAEELTHVPYRGEEQLLWKADYAQLLLDRFPDLELVIDRRLPFLTGDNANAMYLLRKQ